MPTARGTARGIMMGLEVAAILLKKHEICMEDMERICHEEPHHKGGETQPSQKLLKMPISLLLNLQGLPGVCVGKCASVSCFWAIKHW